MQLLLPPPQPWKEAVAAPRRWCWWASDRSAASPSAHRQGARLWLEGWGNVVAAEAPAVLMDGWTDGSGGLGDDDGAI